MGSKVTIKKSRLSKKQYKLLLSQITKDNFLTVYLNNGNEAVCKFFDISLGTMYRLLKYFDIQCLAEQLKKRNKIASEQKLIELYGVTNNFQRADVQQKIKDTNLERYGVANVFQNQDIKLKIKQTCQEKYGVDYTAQIAGRGEKVKQTCLKRYGVDNYAKTEECRAKIIESCLNHYGRTDVGQFGSEEYKKAIQEKYGVTAIACLPEIKAKIKQTNLKNME